MFSSGKPAARRCSISSSAFRAKTSDDAEIAVRVLGRNGGDAFRGNSVEQQALLSRIVAIHIHAFRWNDINASQGIFPRKIYFWSMDRYALTAVTRRGELFASVWMRRKGQAEMESMARIFLSRRKMAASTHSPLVKRYAKCTAGWQESSRTFEGELPGCRVFSAPPSTDSSDCGRAQAAADFLKFAELFVAALLMPCVLFSSSRHGGLALAEMPRIATNPSVRDFRPIERCVTGWRVRVMCRWLAPARRDRLQVVAQSLICDSMTWLFSVRQLCNATQTQNSKPASANKNS